MESFTKKFLALILIIGCFNTHAEPPPTPGGLDETYASIARNVDSRGAELAQRLYNYLKEPCDRSAKDQACGYVEIYPTYLALTKKIAEGLGVTWEGPEKWDDFILRSAYWNLSPFGGLTQEEENALKLDMVRWLLSRRALAESLKHSTPLLLKLNGSPSARAAKTIVPLVRAYFAGLSPVSRHFHILDQIHCGPQQTTCKTFKADGIATLKEVLKNKIQPFITLRSQIAENSSPLLSDLHTALAKIVKLDQMFQQLEHSNPNALRAFAAGRDSNDEFMNSMEQYVSMLGKEIALPKNLSNEARIKIWSYAIALNDLIGTSESVDQMTTDGSVKNAEHLFRPINEIFETLRQFLIDEGIDSEKIFRDEPKAGS